MAPFIPYSILLSKNIPKIISQRTLGQEVLVKKTYQYSSLKSEANKEDPPVKFTQSPASKIPIAEVIGLGSPQKKDRPWYESYVIGLSLLAFINYFIFFREENDIDEILKGESSTPKQNLLTLKIKLHYCEKNNLPTEELKAKIQELLNSEDYKESEKKHSK